MGWRNERIVEQFGANLVHRASRSAATEDLLMSVSIRTGSRSCISALFRWCIGRSLWAVVYARFSYLDSSVSTNIVAAETKNSPSVSKGIPRTELMVAVFGVRLTSRIPTFLEIPINRTFFCWSDTMNVLWWIRRHSRQFKPFVTNRVGEIQSSTNPE